MQQAHLGTSTTLPLRTNGESPILLSDTRQRPGKHNNILAAAARRAVRVFPAELPVGDYMLMTPSGETANVAIDTKRGIPEVEQNTYCDADRVAREMDRAASSDIHLIFLIELADCENIQCAETLCNTCSRAATCAHDGKCPQHLAMHDMRNPVAALADFTAFAKSHGAIVMWCNEEDTGNVVLDLLHGIDLRYPVHIP